jgi:hypothetical protein
MTTIIITLSNSGGELDRTALRIDGTADSAGTLITETVAEFIGGSILLPGDTITITEKD